MLRAARDLAATLTSPCPRHAEAPRPHPKAQARPVLTCLRRRFGGLALGRLGLGVMTAAAAPSAAAGSGAAEPRLTAPPTGSAGRGTVVLRGWDFLHRTGQRRARGASGDAAVPPERALRQSLSLGHPVPCTPPAVGVCPGVPWCLLAELALLWLLSVVVPTGGGSSRRRTESRRGSETCGNVTGGRSLTSRMLQH